MITEMTDVLAEGRITPGCAGMYTDGHTDAWRRIVDFVHSKIREPRSVSNSLTRGARDRSTILGKGTMFL